MSHQTGIQGSAELKEFFSRCKDGTIRAFKVAIKDEELVLEKSCESKGTWEQDILLPCLSNNFILHSFFQLM
ncbi:hypothetical protein AVEN_263705-1 [Araneus ventricosus]|uniref:Uncharacterized protein n=1 Tax=Araneus ventricosus TaxID=182803 RepID=A0A4Y2ATP9_ARAVE|nr:hypothetical protein AVEN_263705-1 [Araneus ventricosus]